MTQSTAPIAKRSRKDRTPSEHISEGMTTSDFVVGILFVLFSLSALVGLGWYYWELHGGSPETFAFWDTGDKKWLEIFFWALFTVLAEHLGRASYWMSENGFQKRDALKYIGTTLEAPVIAFALVFVVINLGVSFGDTSISLTQVPITVMIAFSIIAAYTAYETRQGIGHVSRWLRKQVETRLSVDSDDERQNP